MLHHLLRTAALAAAIAGLAAQDPAADAEAAIGADLAAFRTWLSEYESGAHRMMQQLVVDDAALADAESRMAKVARWNTLPAAQALFAAATTHPTPPGARTSSDTITFHAELQPWKIRAIARRHLADMTATEIDPWLMAMLHDKSLRDEEAEEVRVRADAVLQILGARGGSVSREELVRAANALPPALRLRALDVLSTTADVSLVPTFLERLGDRDADVRIAALNALGTALSPHTDETIHDAIPAEIVTVRDQTITAMENVLTRDKTWQVRSAACHNLARLKSTAAIPALIEGYAAELKRTKDPWAMDVRLHKTLQGMTGQKIPLGSAQPWQQFWKNEGASFRFVAKDDPRATDTDDRYAKFFSLDLDSDRVLFVIDLSGSMTEPITLQSGTTSTGAGTTTTKARLVIDEMRRIVLSLPDGSWFNVVVFSDAVRVWRPTRDGIPELVKMDDEARDDLLGSFLTSIQPRGPTNLYDALDKAIGFAGRGITDKHYALGFDTVYVLSDGAPSYGPVTDKDEIRRQVRETNRLKRLTIHTVTFGEKNDTDFLRLLAEENGGRHVHVE